MDLALFLPAVLALLVAPGPTNTLVAVAGAQAGLRGAVRLIPAELAGYMTTILPVAYAGRHMVDQWPATALLLRICAAAWVLFLGVRLWRAHRGADSPRTVSAGKVYLTTVLNPKALVVGAVLLPLPGTPRFLLDLGLFGLTAAVVAVGWGVFGTLTQAGDGGRRRLQMVQRVASVWLAVISGTLLASAVVR